MASIISILGPNNSVFSLYIQVTINQQTSNFISPSILTDIYHTGLL